MKPFHPPTPTLIKIEIKGKDYLALSKIKSRLNAYPNAFTLEMLIPIPNDYHSAKGYIDNIAEELLVPHLRLHLANYAEIEEELRTLSKTRVRDVLMHHNLDNTTDVEALLDIYIKYTDKHDPTYRELIEWVDSSYKPDNRAHELYLERFRLSLVDVRENIKLAKRHGYTNLHAWKQNTFGYTASPIVRRIEVTKTGDTALLFIGISSGHVDDKVLLKSLKQTLPEFDVDVIVENKSRPKSKAAVNEFFNIVPKHKCAFGTISNIDNDLCSIEPELAPYGRNGRLLARIEDNTNGGLPTLVVTLLSVAPRKQFTIDSATYKVTKIHSSLAETIAKCIDDNEVAINEYFGKYITFRKAYIIGRSVVNTTPEHLNNMVGSDGGFKPDEPIVVTALSNNNKSRFDK